MALTERQSKAVLKLFVGNVILAEDAYKDGWEYILKYNTAQSEFSNFEEDDVTSENP